MPKQTIPSLRETLENMKFNCPSNPLPHGLSSKEIDSILSAIAQRDEVCRPYKPSHCSCTSITEFKQNLERSLA